MLSVLRAVQRSATPHLQRVAHWWGGWFGGLGRMGAEHVAVVGDSNLAGCQASLPLHLPRTLQHSPHSVPRAAPEPTMWSTCTPALPSHPRPLPLPSLHLPAISLPNPAPLPNPKPHHTHRVPPAEPPHVAAPPRAALPPPLPAPPQSCVPVSLPRRAARQPVTWPAQPAAAASTLPAGLAIANNGLLGIKATLHTQCASSNHSNSICGTASKSRKAGGPSIRFGLVRMNSRNGNQKTTPSIQVLPPNPPECRRRTGSPHPPHTS